jgi:DNA-directed RNA polymerase specialized sigma24 family protein
MIGNQTIASTAPISPGHFAPTRWTQVLAARGASAGAQAALGELCAGYWQPVFAFIRGEGRDDETARDLTQEFFTRLLARHGLDTVEPGRGRFRSFLLGAVKHFLADEREHARAAKRGGGRSVLSLEAGAQAATTLEPQTPDPAASAPDTLFDRQWALTLVERAITALAAELAAAGKSGQFNVLKPWLLGELESVSQADAARQLGLTEGAVKVAIHRLRKRFRELVRIEIAQTVEGQDLVPAELCYLPEVLCESQRH